MRNEKEVTAPLRSGHTETLAERRDFVLEQYERLWAGVQQKAREVLDSGERDLGRVHLFMRRNFGPDFENSHLKDKYIEHERSKAASGFLYDRQLIGVHDADTRVITLMTDAVKMREVIDRAGPDVERIVELGAGWGKTLFNLFRFGAPLETEYFALELTDTGRAVARMIADHAAPTMRLHTHFFDYYEPDFPMLQEPRKTCVLTHHSIEQITNLPDGLINRILEIPGFYICVHLEPCGFQIPTNNWLADESAKRWMLEVDAANRRFSEKRNQNRDLYPSLRAYEKEGRIRMHVVRKYFTSHLIDNATTLIVWGPGRGPLSDDDLVNPLRDDLMPDHPGQPLRNKARLRRTALPRFLGRILRGESA